MITCTLGHVIRYLKKPKTEEKFFLSGNFAPVHDAIRAEDLNVKIGKIPKGLNGIYIQNGPNPQFKPRGKYHLFDGDGMIHVMLLVNGKAHYLNKYIETDKFIKEKEYGEALTFGMLHMADPVAYLIQLFDKYVRGRPIPKIHTANTSVLFHNGRLFALNEASPPYELDIDTFKTKGVFTFDGKLKGSMTAHPKIHPITKELIFYSYNPITKPYLTHYVANEKLEITHKTDLDVSAPFIIHDFAITEHFTIFFFYPLSATFDKFITNKGNIISFDEKRETEIWVLPRYMTEKAKPSIKKFKMESCFGWHFANAYEEGDHIIVIGTRAKKVDFLDFNRDTIRNPKQKTYLYEWRLNVEDNSVTGKHLLDDECEFPTINPSKVGLKNRFVYAPTRQYGNYTFDGVTKIDLTTGKTKRFDFGLQRYGGECIFAPKTDAKDEDDGYLMTYVYDETTNSSEFIIIDAKKMDSIPVASVKLPRRVPYGFHGNWIPT